ncbi:hypothetical protein MLD38_038413 [Melastoma candidum]|uniref:Uncharacterized protein n=1 Tax=Melastoma candidum TaxID=119954 RepID=A0ACB9KZI2_9MYRT|nr:hypothetical protein MLD38_038413 [Melastoma candidum]
MANNANHGSQVLEDGEFWLPPQFLSDDDHHHPTSPDYRTFPLDFGAAPALDAGFFPPPEFRTGWRSSNLSSPGESVVSSTEDSDEEDFIAHLTQKAAQSTLGDGFPPHRSSKGLYSSGSPKSTLCSGCGCGHGSIWGNHGGAPQMKLAAPPTLDLLYQAAGKVANMRLIQQRRQIQRAQSLLLQQQQQRQRLNHLIHLSDSKSEVSSYPFQVSSQQLMQFQPPQAPGTGGAKYGKTETVLSSSAWPTLQQARQPRREPVSTSRAVQPVFLGSNNALPRGCAGTGVFLPRRAGDAPDPEPKRKQGCPSVLIPARVAQALNLNLDEMGSHPQIQLRYDGGARNIRGGRQVTPQQTGVHHRTQQPGVGQEISLPPEWTY